MFRMVNYVDWVSKALHDAGAAKLDRDNYEEQQPLLLACLATRERNVSGHLYQRNISRWRKFITAGDIDSMRLTVAGTSEHAYFMRKVSPLGALLTTEDVEEIRQQVWENTVRQKTGN